MNRQKLMRNALKNIELLCSNIATASSPSILPIILIHAQGKLKQIANLITEENVFVKTMPQIMRFSVNNNPYHIEILPWGEWRLVLAAQRKNSILASSDYTQTTKAQGRFVKHQVLSPKAKRIHKNLETITHPCLSKFIVLPTNISNCSEVCIEDSFDVKWENMLTLEKQKKILTADQFLLITFSLVSFLKTLHQQDMILGSIDADTIKLQPMDSYYLPLLKKYNIPFLRSESNDNKKGDDTRRLCRMLLTMDHDNKNAIENLLIQHAKTGSSDTTDTLFTALNLAVSEKIKDNPTDMSLVKIACHAGIKFSQDTNVDAIIIAMNTYAKNHQIDLLHHLAQQQYFKDNKLNLYTRRNEIIRGLNQAQRLSLFYAIPELDPIEDANTTDDNDAYIDKLRHLLRNCLAKKELFHQFFSTIPHEKLYVALNAIYARNDTNEMQALKSVYINIDFEATKFLYMRNHEYAADIAFAHWKVNKNAHPFTTFIDDKILSNDKFARYSLKTHGICVKTGEPLLTQIAHLIIDKKQPKDVNLANVWTGLSVVIEAIKQYEDQVLTLRRQEARTSYFSFRKHSITERQDMCREVVQACSEAQNISGLCMTLEIWIAKLKGHSLFGNSRLAKNLENAKRENQ